MIYHEIYLRTVRTFFKMGRLGQSHPPLSFNHVVKTLVRLTPQKTARCAALVFSPLPRASLRWTSFVVEPLCLGRTDQTPANIWWSKFFLKCMFLQSPNFFFPSKLSKIPCFLGFAPGKWWNILVNHFGPLRLLEMLALASPCWPSRSLPHWLRTRPFDEISETFRGDGGALMT